MLPKHVVAEDRQLVDSVESASEALGRLRWSWTLDESNPDRVTFAEYGRQVGRGDRIISKYSNAYQRYIAHPGGRKFTNVLAKQQHSTEKGVVLDAVADARGVAPKTVSNYRGPEVRRIQEEAHQAADKRGTSFEEEAKRIAERNATFDKKQEESQLQKMKIGGPEVYGRCVELENMIDRSKRPLLEMLRRNDLALSPEESKIITAALGKLTALLNLVNLKYSEQVDIDWDSELMKLELAS